MARHDIRGLKLSDGTYVFSSKDVYNINDNFIQLSQEVFGNSNFSKNMDKRIKKAENDIDAITTTVGDIESEYSQIAQSVDNITLTVSDLNTNTSAQIQILNDEIVNKVTQQDVQSMIDEINQANPNLVSNLDANWEQGDIDGAGGLIASNNHIRTKGFYTVKQGHVYFKISPLYLVKIIVYDQGYNFSSVSILAGEGTFLLTTNAYFKVAVQRTNSTAILPEAINTAELKVENSETPTKFTPYFGDLTLDAIQDFFILEISSTKGWSVDAPNYSTTLEARIYLYNEDITHRFENSQFTWFKQYPNNALVSLGVGKAKTISGSDIEKTVTIICEFEIYDIIYTLTTFGGDGILTMGNDLIQVIGYQ